MIAQLKNHFRVILSLCNLPIKKQYTLKVFSYLLKVIALK